MAATRSRSSSRSPIKSYEQEQIKDHQADNFPQAHNSEDDDFKLALQLSQEEDPVDRGQEERDREMALRLQEQFNRENVPPVWRSPSPSPPRGPFTFDEVPVRKRDNHHVFDDDDDDLPDIPDVRPPDPVRQTSSSLKENEASAFISPKKLSSKTDMNKPGPSRQKPRVVHDMSFVSDDEECCSQITTTTPKKKTPTKSPGSGRKGYVPRQRSGAYAILITLFHEKAKDEYKGFVSKTFLQVFDFKKCEY